MAQGFAMDDDWGFDLGAQDFSLDDLDRRRGDDGIGCPRYLLPRTYEAVATRPVLFERALDFASGLDFSPGMRQLCFLSGNFVFGDVLEAMVALRKVDIRRLTIQTLSLSKENVDSLWNVCNLSPRLEELRMIMSSYFWSHERHTGGLVPYLYQELDQGDVLDVAFAGIHTKMISIETAMGNHVVMHGSANLRSSRNVEQVMVECDDALWECVESFADRILASYSVIDKSKAKGGGIRAGRLWSWLKEGDLDGGME